MKIFIYLSSISILFFACTPNRQNISKLSFEQIEITNTENCLWKYKADQKSKEVTIAPPVFEVDGQEIKATLQNIVADTSSVHDGRNLKTYIVQGDFQTDSTLHLKIIFHVSENTPFVRFKYELSSRANHKLTKKEGKDYVSYLSFSASNCSETKELRLSDYSHKNHCYVPRLLELKESQYSNNDAVMGPIFIGESENQSFLIAYEHGSQYPNEFLIYKLAADKNITLCGVKGNYLNQQPISPDKPFETVWFQLGSVRGSQNDLASAYRNFILKYQSPNTESRKPYIYYNTWGRQEREKWGGRSYQGSITKPVIEKEIEIAHQMGVDVFVIDVGWFNKTGDWRVNTTAFPDTLKQINKLLESKGMMLGLWYNPSITAVSSEIKQNHEEWLVCKNDKIRGPFGVWETEESVNVCMVSDYWKYHADQMIALSKQTGSKYFKWDGLDFDICNDPNHHHGNENNTPQEREESYGYLMPLYMAKIAKRIQKEIPDAIFDFDVTEATRAVGLSFLSVGKYFAMNNGPYFHNFDLAEKFQTPLDNNCSNVFVNPGPARGWFARTVLEYDIWIPSTLFLTHYQPDGDEKSVKTNIASLILGQNGIWGDILNIPEENVQQFNTILAKYKEVKDDITLSSLKHTGKTGDAIEVYEKINPETGKGVVSIFSNENTQFSYCTYLPCNKSYWASQNVEMEFDENGRCKITSNLDEGSAVVLFFGVE